MHARCTAPSAHWAAGCPSRPLTVCRPRRCKTVPAQAASSSAAVAEAGVQTTEGLIFGRGQAGAWDEAAVGNPVVRCYLGDNEQRWLMWYAGTDKVLPGLDSIAPAAGRVGVATSTDGVNWRRGGSAVSGARGVEGAADVGRVLEPNAADWWTHDTRHISVADVQVMSNGSVSSGVGVYWMFSSGGDFEAVPAPDGLPGTEQGQAIEGLRMRPGLAMSQDGRNWARIECDHHTGALFDVGEAGEWDELYIGQPQVLAAGPADMRMYYHSYDLRRQRYVIGLATSPDGFRWTKQGPMFDGGREAGAHDGGGAAACHVVRCVDTKRFLMFYEAVAADGTRSIGLATSADGKCQWQRCSSPLLSASADAAAWDAVGVGAPCAVPMSEGRWRLYYAGNSSKGPGPWEGIGLALSAPGVVVGQDMGDSSMFRRRQGSKAS